MSGDSEARIRRVGKVLVIIGVALGLLAVVLGLISR